MKISSIVLLLLVSTPAYAVYTDSSPPKAIGAWTLLFYASIISLIGSIISLSGLPETAKINAIGKFSVPVKNSPNQAKKEHAQGLKLIQKY